MGTTTRSKQSSSPLTWPGASIPDVQESRGLGGYTRWPSAMGNSSRHRSGLLSRRPARSTRQNTRPLDPTMAEPQARQPSGHFVSERLEWLHREPGRQPCPRPQGHCYRCQPEGLGYGTSLQSLRSQTSRRLNLSVTAAQIHASCRHVLARVEPEDGPHSRRPWS